MRLVLTGSNDTKRLACAACIPRLLCSKDVPRRCFSTIGFLPGCIIHLPCFSTSRSEYKAKIIAPWQVGEGRKRARLNAACIIAATKLARDDGEESSGNVSAISEHYWVEEIMREIDRR